MRSKQFSSLLSGGPAGESVPGAETVRVGRDILLRFKRLTAHPRLPSRPTFTINIERFVTIIPSIPRILDAHPSSSSSHIHKHYSQTSKVPSKFQPYLKVLVESLGWLLV